MADMCLCGLVVEGAMTEVRRFVRAAARSRRNRTSRAATSDCSELSFQSLWPLPMKRVGGLDTAHHPSNRRIAGAVGQTNRQG